MGKAARERPARLAEKLLYVRKALGLSQTAMISHMGLTDQIVQQDISTYEQDQREPPLRILLEYAKSAAGGLKGAGEYLLIFIDDSRDLPERLPDSTPPEQFAVKHRVSSRGKKP